MTDPDPGGDAFARLLELITDAGDAFLVGWHAGAAGDPFPARPRPRVVTDDDPNEDGLGDLLTFPTPTVGHIRRRPPGVVIFAAGVAVGLLTRRRP